MVRLGPNDKVEARYPEVGPYVVAGPGLPYSVLVRLSSALPAAGRYQVNHASQAQLEVLAWLHAQLHGTVAVPLSPGGCKPQPLRQHVCRCC